MENLADMIFDSLLFYGVAVLLDVLMIVFTLLFLNFSAKYRCHKLNVGWYICAVLAGPLTLIVFLIKRRTFPGPDVKKCPQCKKLSGEYEQLCPVCQSALPAINREEKRRQKRLSRIFGIGIITVYALTVILGAVFGYNLVSSPELFEEDDRISVNGVFYDKKGNSYENEDDVILYDEDGRVYTYLSEELQDESMYFSYETQYYVRDDGEKYYALDCYVTEDGWFYCDKGYMLELYSEDTSEMTEEELDKYYQEQMTAEAREYRYYDYPYTDGTGTLYYSAYEASWNEKGELITAENDIYQ